MSALIVRHSLGLKGILLCYQSTVWRYIIIDIYLIDFEETTAYISEWIDEVVLSVCQMIWVHRVQQSASSGRTPSDDITDSKLSPEEASLVVGESVVVPQVLENTHSFFLSDLQRFFCTFRSCASCA